jgi:hypothetical protein
MTTTSHPTTGFALPNWTLRTVSLVIAAIVVAATVLAVVLTQFVGSSGGHATTPGISRVEHNGISNVQKPGVAGQNGGNAGQNAADQCGFGSGLLPRAC